MTQPPALSLENMALAVADLPAMTRWYVDVLGLHLAEQGRFDPVGADYAMLDGDSAGGGFRLELVSRPDGAHRPVDRSPPPLHLDVLGWKALVLRTGDLAGWSDHLQGHGVEMVWEQAQLTPTRRSTMIRDPEGNLVHIFGPLS